MTVQKDERPVPVTLEHPIPLLGLHAQKLGVVKRCRLFLTRGVVETVELQTRWQRIELDRSAVTYDRKANVFRLLRADTASKRID